MDNSLYEEINKILVNEKVPSISLNKLKKEGKFKNTSLEVVDKLSDIEQNLQYHPEGSVWNHICMVVDTGAEVRELANNKEVFMWSTFLHDIGKLTTTKMIRGKLRSYDHDVVGEEMSYNLLKEVYGNGFAYKVSKLVRFHMHHIFILKNLPFKNMAALVKEADINDLMLVFYSDKMGRGGMDEHGKERIFKDMYIILDEIEKYNCDHLHNIRKNISIALQ